MGVSLLKGREVTDRDNQSSPAVIAINSALAHRLFDQQDPIGRRITFAGDEPRPYEIIGVVDDERVGPLDEEAASVVYRPSLQEPWTKLALIVRTAGDPQAVVSAVRSELLEMDHDLAPYSVTTMEQLINETPSTFLRRYPALLISVFASLALILAAVGIYGVISYTVSQRTHEIGIRMALGAQTSDVLKLIVRQGMSVTLIGVVIGLAASFALTRLLKTLLFDVSATDPLTYTGVAGLLLIVALIACYLPARRAAKVDPLTAVRHD
jgi:putative ABC transport system permease protein